MVLPFRLDLSRFLSRSCLERGDSGGGQRTWRSRRARARISQGFVPIVDILTLRAVREGGCARRDV